MPSDGDDGMYGLCSAVQLDMQCRQLRRGGALRRRLQPVAGMLGLPPSVQMEVLGALHQFLQTPNK